MEDIVIPIFAIAMVFGIPLAAILSGPLKQWLAQRERREARQLYERLTLEKLDIIKTAVAVGMKKDDLGELDDKLERLIGAEQMQSLLLTKEPRVPSDADELRAQLTRAEYDEIYGSRGREAGRN